MHRVRLKHSIVGSSSLRHSMKSESQLPLGGKKFFLSSLIQSILKMWPKSAWVCRVKETIVVRDVNCPIHLNSGACIPTFKWYSSTGQGNVHRELHLVTSLSGATRPLSCLNLALRASSSFHLHLPNVNTQQAQNPWVTYLHKWVRMFVLTSLCRSFILFKRKGGSGPPNCLHLPPSPLVPHNKDDSTEGD